jgi:hypothetical protein
VAVAPRAAASRGAQPRPGEARDPGLAEGAVEPSFDAAPSAALAEAEPAEVRAPRRRCASTR